MDAGNRALVAGIGGWEVDSQWVVESKRRKARVLGSTGAVGSTQASDLVDRVDTTCCLCMWD